MRLQPTDRCAKKVKFSESRLMALPCPICLKIPVFSEEIVLSPIGNSKNTARKSLIFFARRSVDSLSFGIRFPRLRNRSHMECFGRAANQNISLPAVFRESSGVYRLWKLVWHNVRPLIGPCQLQACTGHPMLVINHLRQSFIMSCIGGYAVSRGSSVGVHTVFYRFCSANTEYPCETMRLYETHCKWALFG